MSEDEMLRKEIIEAFSKYENGKSEKRIIEKYSERELRRILSGFDSKRHESLARAMQKRLTELEQAKEKRRDRVVAFLLGVIGSLAAQFLLKKFGLL